MVIFEQDLIILNYKIELLLSIKFLQNYFSLLKNERIHFILETFY